MLLIGIGNEYRSDDGVGLYIARELRKYSIVETRVIEHSGEGASLIETWQGEEKVVLFDAVKSGTFPGTVFRFDAQAGPLPAEFFSYSTHAFGVVQAIELARTLGQLPKQLVVYGVEGTTFEAGVGLSLEAMSGARQIIERVLPEINKGT